MAFLSSIQTMLEVPMPKGLWEWLIGTVFNFIGNYGVRILVFTVLLKLLLFPLDIYQKKIMRDNAKKMERMKPTLDKLKEQYGADKNSFQQAQMALMKKEKYSTFSSCLPMLVTMVIFFTMYAGFTNISSYKMMQTYDTLYWTYDKYDNNLEVDGVRPISLDQLQAEFTRQKTFKTRRLYCIL